ncbi:MAG: SpoVR family protein, partial [Steroidobacteraceae bacterium]|nr:SpoVR family protein [Steroidobacteraceae bacterium]MDW8260148.1 SpoVR family protein [Gammaproteobacteria bacterium]
READFLPQHAYVDAIKCHSDVVRPLAGGEKVALSINPYHLGFVMWEQIVEDRGLDFARRVMREDDDISFVRNYLTAELADKLQLFRYTVEPNDRVRVMQPDIDALHEALLAPKYNFGAPSVAATRIGADGSLELTHDHKTDGRGLDVERARHVVEYLRKVWRRPVRLQTVDGDGRETTIAAAA